MDKAQNSTQVFCETLTLQYNHDVEHSSGETKKYQKVQHVKAFFFIHAFVRLMLPKQDVQHSSGDTNVQSAKLHHQFD